MQVLSASYLERSCLYSFSHVFLIGLELKVEAPRTNLDVSPT